MLLLFCFVALSRPNEIGAPTYRNIPSGNYSYLVIIRMEQSQRSCSRAKLMSPQVVPLCLLPVLCKCALHKRLLQVQFTQIQIHLFTFIVHNYEVVLKFTAPANFFCFSVLMSCSELIFFSRISSFPIHPQSPIITTFHWLCI